MIYFVTCSILSIVNLTFSHAIFMNRSPIRFLKNFALFLIVSRIKSTDKITLYDNIVQSMIRQPFSISETIYRVYFTEKVQFSNSRDVCIGFFRFTETCTYL